MFRLLSFLSDARNVLLFLLLEVVALVFIVRHNDRQRHAFGDAVLQTSSKIQEKRNEFDRYFMLDEENAALMRENIELRKQIARLEKRVNMYSGILMRDSIKWLAQDTILSREMYRYIPCRAIRATTDRNYNYITLNKGSDHGVQIGMGLVSPQGVAGMVVHVSQSYSLALSMLNISFKLSAKVKRNENVGSFEWTGSSTRYGYLRYIPINAELHVGDEVVTSGYSTIFPEGFPIGKIAKIKPDPQSGAYEVEVALATDFNALSNLYLVPSVHKPQLDSLESKLTQ